MIAPKYSISVGVGGVDQRQIWDSSKPLDLGCRLLWSIERGKDRKVRLKHKQGSEFELTPEVLKSGNEIELKDPGNKSGVPILVRVHQLVEPKAAVEVDSTVSKEGSHTRWEAFACAGKWLMDSKLVGPGFVAHKFDEPVFMIYEDHGRHYLKLSDQSAEVHGIERSIAEKGKGIFKLDLDELDKVSITSGAVTWRFRPVDVRMMPKFVERVAQAPALDPETRFYRKTQIGTVLSLLLLLLISFFMAPSEPEKPKEEPAQLARIDLSKYMPHKQAANDSIRASAEGQTAVEKPSQEEAHQKTKAQTKAVPRPAAKMAQNATHVNKPAEHPVTAPAKPQPSLAMRNAEKFSNSMKSLLNLGKNSAVLRESAKTGKGGGPNAGGILGDSKIANSGRTEAPVGSLLGTQEVQVGYTNAGNGKGEGSGGKGYGSVGPGTGMKGGKGGSNFVAVSVGDETSAFMDEGGLTKKEVWEVINRHYSEVRYCYDRALIRRPDVEGKLLVNFTIGKVGNVKKYGVKASTLPDTYLDSCIKDRLVRWEFPKPRGNVTDVSVSYPFVFKRL